MAKKDPFAVDSVCWIVDRFGYLRQTFASPAALGPLGHLAQEGMDSRRRILKQKSLCLDLTAPVTRGAALRGAGLYLRRMTNESKFGPVLDSLAKRSFDWVSFNRRKCKESGTWPH